MKIKLIIIPTILIFIKFISGCGYPDTSQDNGNQNNYNQNNQDNSGYNEYNVDDLNQYGYWQDDSQFGRCWRPSVVSDWAPFTNGHWVYDGNDWVWVSYEPFGWIVYHYGYWENTPEYGWVWIPSDDQWSPARVQWFNYGDEVGWAPLRPNNRSWGDPWDRGGNGWVVVRKHDFINENIHSYRIRTVDRIGNNPGVVNRAPEVRTIQQLVKKGFFTCDAFIRIADFLNQKQEQNTSKVVHMYDLIL